MALAEPLLRDQIVTAEGDVTAINVVLQYPQKGFSEVPEAPGSRGRRESG